MKSILAILAVSLLLLAGCRENSDTPDSSISASTSGPTSSQIESSGYSEAPQEIDAVKPSLIESSTPEQQDRRLNSALDLILGGKRLLADEQGLFLLKEYGSGMKWTEANQLEHLDRGTPVTDLGTYFLMLPKYTGSVVEVQRLAWNDTDFVPSETLYRNESTPDSYGLVLTSDELEGGPNLYVTVTNGNEQSSCTFSYDGQGDRPAVMVFPGDERSWENQLGFKLFQSLSGNHTIQMEIPDEWDVMEPPKELPHIIVTLSPEGKQVSYNIWFIDTADVSPEEYLEPMNEGLAGDFTLEDGRIGYYIMSKDSPISYTYALKVDGLTVVMMSHFLEDIPEPLPEGGYRSMLRPPHEAIPEFIKSLQSIQVIG